MLARAHGACFALSGYAYAPCAMCLGVGCPRPLGGGMLAALALPPPWALAILNTTVTTDTIKTKWLFCRYICALKRDGGYRRPLCASSLQMCAPLVARLGGLLSGSPLGCTRGHPSARPPCSPRAHPPPFLNFLTINTKAPCGFGLATPRGSRSARGFARPL